MKLNIKPLVYEDYDNHLVGWWKDWNWTPPTRDFLPQDGVGGMMVYDGDIPVCAGFLYNSNAKLAWGEWVISNKSYGKGDKRTQALVLLVETLTDMAKSLNKKYVYALIKNPSLAKVYKDLGYIEGDSYNTEMIKIIN